MRAAVAAALALLAALAAAQVAIPPVARVTDQTGTLDAAQRAALEQRLAALERAKGSQLAVLIVPTTAPETIEQYGIRVGDAWRLGRKGVDDGAILLVAKNDRALRIEVGYGLEGAVPDAIARRIVDEIIVPRFRAGDFYGGIDAGVDQLSRVIEGEALPEPPRPRAGAGGRWAEALFPIAIAVLAISQLFGRGIGEVPAALAAGGIFGVVAWLILGAALFGAFAGMVLFVISLASQLGRGGRGGGYGGGGWSSRGGFGGGGGGGFRGGGGGFGGGGASGRW